MSWASTPCLRAPSTRTGRAARALSRTQPGDGLVVRAARVRGWCYAGVVEVVSQCVRSRHPRGMRIRLLPSFTFVLLLVGCSVPTSSTVPVATRAGTASPEATPPADCVNPPRDVATLVEQGDPAACYGSADLSLDAHLTTAIGAIDCPGGLEPAWLGCDGLVSLRTLPGTSNAPANGLTTRLLSTTSGPWPTAGHPLVGSLYPHSYPQGRPEPTGTRRGPP